MQECGLFLKTAVKKIDFKNWKPTEVNIVFVHLGLFKFSVKKFIRLILKGLFFSARSQ
jgi:hypothetical protein